MRHLLAFLFMACVAGAAHAAHNGGSDTNTTPLSTANCNASFQSGCAQTSLTTTTTTTTNTVSSSGFAAPVGAVGESAVESIALAVMVAGAAWSWRRRRRATSAAPGCLS